MIMPESDREFKHVLKNDRRKIYDLHATKSLFQIPLFIPEHAFAEHALGPRLVAAMLDAAMSGTGRPGLQQFF